MAAFSDLVVKLELQQASFQKGMDFAARSLARVQQSAKGAQGSMGGLEGAMKGVAQAAAAVGTAFAAIKSIEAITKATAQLQNLQGSFTALLGSAERAQDMMGRVFGVVARTGAPLDAVGASMQRLSIAMTGLGASNQQIQAVTETFIQLGKVGGSSAAETAGALQQLGQALASGKLGGDELRSIRENAPLVAQAIADAIGVTSGQLKQLGEDGKLTSDVVANALIGAAGKAGEAFAKLPQGFEQAVNKMEAQAVQAAAAFDKVGGTTSTLVTTVNFVADALKRWTDELAATNTQLNSTQIIAQSVNDVLRLIQVGFVALTFALEQLVKLTGKWAAQLKALVELDWSGVIAAQKDWADQFDRAAEAAERTIRVLMNMPVPQLQTGETGGEPQIAPRKLNPPAATGGGGGGGGKSAAQREAEELKKRGEALAAAVDGQEAYNQKLREYDELLAKGAITQATFEKAVAKAHAELTAAGDALKASVDPYEEHRQAVEKINKAYLDGSIEIEHWLKLMEEADKQLKDKTKGPKSFKEDVEDLEKSMAKAMGTGIGEFFGDLARGAMTAEQAFNKMVQSMIKKLAELLAEFAAAQITKGILSLIGGGAGVSGSGIDKGAPASLMLATRPPTFNAQASLAGPQASTRAGEPAAVTGGAGAASSPWNVVINNNAPGVDVNAAARSDGGLEITVERVRSMLAQDVARGGNPFSRSLESAYGLGRGR